MMMQFGNVKSDAGLAALDAHLLSHSYIEGFVPSAADLTIISKLTGAPQPAKYPNVARWHKHISSFAATEVAPGPVATTKAPKVEEEEEVDLFGDGGDAADIAAAMSAKAAEKKAAEGKKGKAPVVGKSTVTLEIRGTSSDVNLDDLAKSIHAIEIEGLTWVKAWEIRKLFFGLNALIMGCIIIDELVPLENITRAIMCVGLTEELAAARNDALDQGIDFDEEDECPVKSVSVMSFVKL